MGSGEDSEGCIWVWRRKRTYLSAEDRRNLCQDFPVSLLPSVGFSIGCPVAGIPPACCRNALNVGLSLRRAEGSRVGRAFAGSAVILSSDRGINIRAGMCVNGSEVIVPTAGSSVCATAGGSVAPIVRFLPLPAFSQSPLFRLQFERHPSPSQCRVEFPHQP